MEQQKYMHDVDAGMKWVILSSQARFERRIDAGLEVNALVADAPLSRTVGHK
jgi:hypothetical protein